MRLGYLGCLTLLAAPPVASQSSPAVDSAEIARIAWRRAAEALDRGDDDAAWSGASRAARAWPEQSVYWRGLASVAAHRRDPTTLIEALDRLTAFQADAGLPDSAVAPLRDRPAVARALARGAAAIVPRRRSRLALTVTDTTAFAEGIDVDPASGVFYLASVRHRTIYALGPAGAVRDLGLAGQPRIGAVLGVRFDRGRGVLWATTAGLPQGVGYRPADSSLAALLMIRPVDGTVIRRWELPAAVPHVPGDLALGRDGSVFVTDSRSPWLFRLAPGTDTLTGRTDPLFRSLQGPAPAPDGRALYLADYSHGILRHDLTTGRSDRLEAPPGVTTLGVDGLLWYRGDLIGVQNGIAPPRIVRFRLDRSGRRIVAAQVLDRSLPEADQPTIGTMRRGEYFYVANSQWDQYDDDGVRRPGTVLRPTQIRAIRLP